MNEWDIALHGIRNHGRSILAGTVIGCICAILVMIFQKPVYQAIMIVGPTEKTGVPSLNSFLPKAAADAPALQYFVERIDASRATDFTVFETKISSPDIITSIAKNKSFGIPPDTQKWARNHLKIRSQGMTPFRKITVEDHNVSHAIAILNALYETTDQSIRADKKLKTVRRISYLNQQLKTVRNPDHRDAIVALLKEQEQIAMMVSIDNEFAAEIITPAYVSEKPIAPNGKILFPAFMFAGGFLGLMLSGLRKAMKK
jgi:hypothetical protein